MAGNLHAVARPALRAMKAVDRALGRLGGRRSVLIEARTPMNLAVLHPVFERLMQDGRVDVRFTGTSRDDLRAAFDELGIADRVIDRSRAAWTRIDLYINADPWEAVALRRAARQMNFFHGVAGKYNLDCPASLPLGFDRYDRVAFPNEGRLQRYVEGGIVSPAQAALVGYPKVDALAQHSGPAAAAAAADLGLDSSRKTAVFAPTFSPASALNEAGEAIVETLLAIGCNVIAKLHDRSLDPDPRYNGGIDWRQRFSRFSDPTRFLLADSGDSTRFVLASDVMVTDHSSIGFEFCVLDRPLIVFDAPRLAEAARINPEKIALLRSAATVVRDADSLSLAVRLALANPAAQSAPRRHAASQVFFDPGGATDRALGVIYELLEIAPALHAPAHPAAVPATLSHAKPTP